MHKSYLCIRVFFKLNQVEQNVIDDLTKNAVFIIGNLSSSFVYFGNTNAKTSVIYFFP